MSLSSNGDSDIPTAQIGQLMNSLKINSETNVDYKTGKSSSSESILSDKENILLVNMFNDLKAIEEKQEKQAENLTEENLNNEPIDIKETSVSDDIEKMIKRYKSDNLNKPVSSLSKSSRSKSSSSSSYDNDKNYKKGITTEINDIFYKNNKNIKESPERQEYEERDEINNNSFINNEEVDDREIDEYENLTPSKKKLARMDILRKLAELKKKGYLISNNYTINSDYYTMKEEYEYQMTIKGKDSFVKNSFCYGLNIIKLLEFANKKYDPLGIDLEGWNINVESSKEEIIDAIGEIYEKYHKPGSGVMSPELRLLIILVSSAASTIIANSGAKMLASIFKNSQVIDNKEDVIKNLNNQLNQQQTQEPINKYTIQPPKIPDSLMVNIQQPKKENQEINKQSQQPVNNVFNNMIQQQRMSKKNSI